MTGFHERLTRPVADGNASLWTSAETSEEPIDSPEELIAVTR